MHSPYIQEIKAPSDLNYCQALATANGLHVDLSALTHVFALYVQGKLAAFAGLDRAPNRPHTFYLRSCLVLPSFRGLGYQQLLLRHRITIAQQAGGHKMLVCVAPTNRTSLHNLLKFGFTPTQRQLTFSGTTYDEYQLPLPTPPAYNK